MYPDEPESMAMQASWPYFRKHTSTTVSICKQQPGKLYPAKKGGCFCLLGVKVHGLSFLPNDVRFPPELQHWAAETPHDWYTELHRNTLLLKIKILFTLTKVFCVTNKPHFLIKNSMFDY